MGSETDDPVYYVISDLHIGGDEQLEYVDFLDELLNFLDRLARTDEDAELIINGDAFGLWEFTELTGLEKLDALLTQYDQLFEQFRVTGTNVPITMLPGNHDHELAAYDEYVERFAEYNIDLRQVESLTRPIGDRVIHFEHGHQEDPNNRIEDFGNPHATPMGYFYNTQVTSRAGRLSERGRYNWLKDVQAVTPTERLPQWLASKYFYREMNPWLRYATVPFLFLFNVSLLVAVFAGLGLAGVWAMPVERADMFLAQFGLAGTAVHFLLVVNVVIVGLLVLIAIPIEVFIRDVRKTVDRFGITETELTVDPDTPYRKRAHEIFTTRPKTAIFCYGHTHRPTMQVVDDGVIVNTGTWLKRLHRRDVVAGRLLPPVFYPSYQLCVVRIASTDSGIEIEYEAVDKANPTADELTRTERLLTLGRKPNSSLPGRAVITDDGPVIQEFD